MDTIFLHPAALFVVVVLPLFGIAAKVFGASFQKITKWYLYIAVFCVIVVMDSIFFPFIGGKDWFFRLAVELSLISALLWWAFEARQGEFEERIRAFFKKPLVLAVSAFALMVLLASLFAFDAHAGFWSNFERGEGGFQMIHYWLFFVLLGLFLREEKEWRRLLGSSLVAAVLMIFYGLLSISGAPGFISPYAGGGAPSGWFAQLIQGRFEGSLGNPAYVAPYLMFAMFFAAYLWITGGRKEEDGRRRTLRNWGYGILIVAFLLFFALSQTRGAFVGLVAGIYALLVYFGYQQPRYRKLILGILAVLFLVGGIIVHYVHQEFLVNPQSLLSAIPGIRLFDLPLNNSVLAIGWIGAMLFAAIVMFARERKWLWWALAALIVVAAIGSLYVISIGRFPSFKDPTTVTRFWVWGEAWQAFLARPVLGWGPENFTAPFDKYFNPNFYVPGQNTETWFDRAHSVFFDYLAETGILGLLAYISMFVLFYIEFFKRRGRRTEGGEPRADHTLAQTLVNGIFFTMPIAYLVQGVAIFDVLPMYIPLFMFLAFSNFYFREHKA
ncbi:MAG: O-antigen ligase family protein [Patescibacteria group bacterium]|nr:O-antigen ligase family protein [Patescibacteria group bacterium]